MALTLLYSHSLAFANTAAYRAEFQYDPPTDTSSSTTASTDYGATNGPDGGPGVYKVGGSGAFGFDKFPLAPQGHLFRVKGRWKELSTGSDGAAIRMWWSVSGNRIFTADKQLLQINFSATGTVTLVLGTRPPYGNAGAGYLYNDVHTSAIPIGSAFDFWIDGRRSTMVESPPGTFTPQPDGWVKAYVNGVEIASISGIPLAFDVNTIGDVASSYWNGIDWKMNGSLSNIEVWHDPTTSLDPIDPSETDPCCGSSVNPSDGTTTAGSTPGEDTSVAYGPWTRNCVGEGLVAEAATPSDSEAWS